MCPIYSMYSHLIVVNAYALIRYYMHHRTTWYSKVMQKQSICFRELLYNVMMSAKFIVFQSGNSGTGTVQQLGLCAPQGSIHITRLSPFVGLTWLLKEVATILGTRACPILVEGRKEESKLR